MSVPPSLPAAAPTDGAPTAKPRRRPLAAVLRFVFGGKRAFATVPIVLLGGWVGWKAMVYQWYRGVSIGERTGVITKISHKGSPLCRYESVEMRVGQQAGAAVMGSETWEFTIDDENAALIPQLEEAERKQTPITVKYRQDSRDINAQPVAPPNNLPWRYCVPTSYHATGILK